MAPLRIFTVLLALIPIATGAVSLLGLSDPLYSSAQLTILPVLDSNLRFLGGVWCALGFALLWSAFDLAKRWPIFRTVWMAIFVGGLGRVLSMVFVGLPPLPFVFFTVLEIAGAPLFLYWHSKVCNSQLLLS